MLSVLVAIFHFYEISSQARLLRQRYVPLIVPLGIAAVACGFLSRQKIAASTTLRGSGMALAGRTADATERDGIG